MYCQLVVLLAILLVEATLTIIHHRTTVVPAVTLHYVKAPCPAICNVNALTDSINVTLLEVFKDYTDASAL